MTTVRIPRHFDGPARGISDVPTQFPDDIDDLPPVPFDGGKRTFRLAYRPYESPHDPTGWRGERSALLSEKGEWFRIPFEALQLEDETWFGPDTLGPGYLNSQGNQVMFNASKGALLIDLRSGATRFVLRSAGYLGLVRWAPDSDVIFASAPRASKDYRIDVGSGVSKRLTAPSLALGFTPSGQPCYSTSPGPKVVNVECGPEGARSTRTLRLPDAAAGDQYQNWSSSKYVALRSLGHRSTYAFDLSDGHLIGELKATERVATYMTVHGWISPDLLLFSMSSYLVTWNPSSGELTKVGTLPKSDVGGAHGSVGVTFPPLLHP